MAKRVLSIDPSGTGTTGFYFHSPEGEAFFEFKNCSWKEHLLFTQGLIKLRKPNLIIYEDTNFISNRSKDSLNLIRLLGAIECLAIKTESINVLKVKELSKQLFKGKTKIDNLQYLPGRGKGWMWKGKDTHIISCKHPNLKQGEWQRISIHQLEAYLVWYLYDL